MPHGYIRTCPPCPHHLNRTMNLLTHPPHPLSIRLRLVSNQLTVSSRSRISVLAHYSMRAGSFSPNHASYPKRQTQLGSRAPTTERHTIELGNTNRRPSPELVTTMSDNDELAEIDGIKPKVYLQDGVEQEVNSASRYVSDNWALSTNLLFRSHSSSTYKVKRTWDHYYW
jgi:hypothetical protein